jgi:hypothetical protein
MPLEHWRYFLALEKDLEATFRYVEPSEQNLKAYSIEFARLILSACSEIDVVSKVLCQRIDAAARVGNIDEYRGVLLGAFPRLPTLAVMVPQFSIQIHPWNEWAAGVNPGWWKEHNLVKHHRHTNFHLADLHHAIVSMAGLYSLLLYLYQKELYEFRLHPRSSVFRLTSEPIFMMSGSYELPDFPRAVS